MNSNHLNSINLMPKEGELEENEDPDIANNQEGEAALQPFSVYVRIRPLLAKAGRKPGGKSEKKQMMHVRGQNQQILQVFENVEKATNGLPYGEGDSSSFLFDRVFCDQQTNLAVFQSALQPLIPQLLEGYNVSCFAYGMTGSGKTHTMLGADGGQAQDTAYESEMDALKNLGLCNLAIQNLFYQMLLKQDEFTYTLSVSYVELYNEQVRDLLADMGGYQGDGDLQNYVAGLLGENHLLRAERGQIDQNTAFNANKQNVQKNSSAQNLKIVEDPIKGVIVQNLQEVPVAEASDLMDLIKLGNQRRIVANTGANRFSSRSHAILIFNIEGLSKDQTVTRFIRSKLQIIDLAGSERAASTENRGQRMVEGALINKSLLALGQCINMLSEQCKKATNARQIRRAGSPSPTKGRKASIPHSPNNAAAKGVQKFIPYRDSKLTRLLKDSLGGSTKTVMIACINQLVGTYEETMNTIKYASKAKSIQNQRVKNEIIQKEYALEAEAQLQLHRQQLQQEAEARGQQELAQIQNLKEEIERLRGSQTQVQKVGKNYLTPAEDVENSMLAVDDTEKIQSQTKLQRRKSEKQQKNTIANNHPVEQLLSSFLVPNIVMQYNLRYQLQSHEVLKQMHGQVHEEEVEKLHEDLSQAQEDQEDIQTSIIEMYIDQRSQIEELQRQLQDRSNTAREGPHDDLQEQHEENQNLKYQNTLKAQEIAELEEVLKNMSEELEEKNQIIEEQDCVENVYQAQIEKQQQQQINTENELNEMNEELQQSMKVSVDLEQSLNHQSQQVTHLQNELARAQAALRQAQGAKRHEADLDPKALYQMNPLDQNSNPSDKSGVQWRQRHQYSQDNTNMESSYLNSCLNITEHINTTLECNTTLDQNDMKPPAAAKAFSKKKAGKHQSRNQANDQNTTAKNSSKDGAKKQKSLQRYLSGASKEGKQEVQQKNENNVKVNTSISNMRYIVKRERPEKSGNSLAKSQSHLDLYEREQGSKDAELDLRNQKFKKMENSIFGESGPLVSLGAQTQLNRMRTLQTAQEREAPAYPKLRQSASNTKFQKNFKPRASSRLSRSRSKSNPRQEGKHSLHRCHTNMDVIQPQNILTLGTNRNIGTNANDAQSFTFQSQQHPSFRKVQAKPPVAHDTLNLQSLENFQLPNLMNVSGISMEFDLGDDMARAEILNHRNQLGEGDGGIGLRKQEKSNPFFKSEENEGNSRRELGHSKSVLTQSAQKQGDIMSPQSRTYAQHSKTNSGALISVDAIQKDYNELQRNEQARGPRVKDLISYAEVREQSKDRRKQQNAVKNLALNFQNFKNTQTESQRNMQNQMLIVDSIENELIKAQGDPRRAQDKDELGAYPNDGGSPQELRPHRIFGSAVVSQQQRPILDQFVEDNNKKMQEIQQIAEQIEMRSIERSQERPGSLKKQSLNTTTEMRNKFGVQNTGVALSSKFKAQSGTEKYDVESPDSGRGDSRRGAGDRHYQGFDKPRPASKTDIPVSPSPPRRKPNFQVPEYQTEMGLFRVEEGPSDRSQRSSNKTGQNTQRQTERKKFNPQQIIHSESHRSHLSKVSESSQIFKNFEKTRNEVRQSLERSPNVFASRQKLQQVSNIQIEAKGPNSQDQQLQSLELNQGRSHTPVKQSNYTLQDQRIVRNHQSSMDFQTSAQQTRMAQYFQMNSNKKSPNTLQTSLKKEEPFNRKADGDFDDSIQSIEKFRDLQRQISAKYVAKAFASKSKNSRKSLSKTPERSHNYAQNLEEFASNGDELVQTQEKHHLKQYIKHDFDQPKYQQPISTPQTLFSPEAKARFHLNLELINQNDDEIATDSKRVNPLIDQQQHEYNQSSQYQTHQNQSRFSQVSSISDRYFNE